MKMDNYQTLSKFIDIFQKKGRYFFTQEEAVKHIGFSHDAFRFAVYRLSAKNRIKRVRGDFYIIIPLEYQGGGSLPVSWFIDDYMQYEKVTYYVGLLTAAAIHGAIADVREML